MKKIFLLVLSLGISLLSFATNYYLSNSGSDLNSGTSSSSPWQTIDQLNSIGKQPGDSIFFECGSIFRGEIIVTSGGTESTPIYFGKYGMGDLPVISGAELVTGWSLYSGNIYKATFSQTPAHLFADDKQMTIARFPNSGYLIHQDGIGNLGFIDSNLTQPNGYWNGANVRMRTTQRVWEQAKVNSSSNDTVLLQTPAFNSLLDGYGYYFDNLLSVLDTGKEWYYDSGVTTIYFNAPGNANPSTINVEASSFEYGILIQNGSSYVVINDLQFEKQKVNGIYAPDSVSDIAIDSCSFSLQGESAIALTGGSSDCSIQANNFFDDNGFAIFLDFAHSSTIAHNQMKRIGLIPGYGRNSPDNLTAIVCNNADSILLSQNVIDSAGSSGIFAGMKNSLIEKNILNHCLLNLNDLGAIYIYGYTNNTSNFDNNIVLNTIGSIAGAHTDELNASGIYIDEYAEGNNISVNTVAYATAGILISKGSSFNSLHRNLIYGCEESQLILEEGSIEGNTTGNEIFGNVFYSLNELSDVVKLSSAFDTFEPAAFDSNYYFNPYAYPVFKTELGPSGISFPTYYTLNQWQNSIGIDQNSHSTFFHHNRFAVTDTVNSNLISNSFFSNNFDGWISNESDTFDLLLDNSTPLDFGCMKLVFVHSSPDTVYGVYTSGFKMDSGLLYQFHLSNYSVNEGNVVLKSKENDDFSGGYVAPPQAFPFDNSRHDYNGFIMPTQSCVNCLLSLEINGLDSVVWLDNVTLYNVSGILQVPEKKSRLFLNTSDNSLAFDLGDSIFFKLDQVSVSGSFTLGPYSSAVLIFDSSMILSVHENVLPQLLKIFPNPVLRGSTITLLIPHLSDDSEISICDLEGRKLFNKMIAAPQKIFQIKIPSFISPGTYFLSTKNKYGVWSGTVVVL